MNLVDKVFEKSSSLIKRAKRKALIYSIGTILSTPFFFTACGGGDGGGGSAPKKEQVFELNDKSMSKIVSYKDYTLSFTEKTPQLESLNVGYNYCPPM